MELIYTNLHTIDGNKLNLEFCFSNDFKVSYNQTDKKIFIEKSESKLPKNFFGNNINNINLVVGKNASRKTTLLKVLGLKRKDLYNSFDKETDSWFSIYSTQDPTKFFIEGNDFSLIKEFRKLENPNKEFFINGIYDYNKNEFVKIKFGIYSDHHEKENIQVLYYPSSMTKAMNYVSEVQGYKYTRHYVTQKKLSDMLSFLTKDYTEFVNYLEKSNELKLCLKVNENEKEVFSNRNGDNFKIYGLGKTQTAILRSNKLHKFMDESSKTNYILSKLSNKQKYITNYLEQQILSAWNSFQVAEDDEVKNIEGKTVDWPEDIVKEINSLFEASTLKYNETDGNKTIEKKYNLLIKYQKSLLEIFGGFLENRYLGDDPDSAYLESKLVFLDKIQRIPEHYFSSRNLISILLDTIEVHESIYDLIETLDEYNFAGEYRKNTLSTEITAYIPSLSDGQAELIDLLVKIRTTISLSQIYNKTNKSNILLLLDEPGVYLHPEWSRKLINYLTTYLNNQYPEIIFQIIITTHSPILLSDIPDYSTLKIVSNKKRLMVTKGEGGYGKNIYELMKDSFFLDAFIGEFAEKKINDLIIVIDKGAWISDASKKDKIIKEVSLVEDQLVRKGLENKIKNIMAEQIYNN